MPNLVEKFFVARRDGTANKFLKANAHVWHEGNKLIFSDGSTAYLHGLDRTITDKEVTEAVRRFCRRHGHYANTVRQNTALFRDAVREYRLDFPS